mmetsp:Transcript_36739/g.123057  ORF Transcript_36739/g.123057 Transcript_36739/m.123057 type:complete len:347 (-) Transcript_36739:158-1198(-)
MSTLKFAGTVGDRPSAGAGPPEVDISFNSRSADLPGDSRPEDGSSCADKSTLDIEPEDIEGCTAGGSAEACTATSGAPPVGLTGTDAAAPICCARDAPARLPPPWLPCKGGMSNEHPGRPLPPAAAERTVPARRPSPDACRASALMTSAGDPARALLSCGAGAIPHTAVACACACADAGGCPGGSHVPGIPHCTAPGGTPNPFDASPGGTGTGEHATAPPGKTTCCPWVRRMASIAAGVAPAQQLGTLTTGLAATPRAAHATPAAPVSTLAPPLGAPFSPGTLALPAVLQLPLLSAGQGGADRDVFRRCDCCDCCSPRTVLMSTSAPSTMRTRLQNSRRSISLVRI